MKLGCVIAGRTAMFLICASAVFGEIVHESGDFVAEVERLKTLAFANDSGLYVLPTSEQQSTFTIVAQSLFSWQLDAAGSNAVSLGYELVEFKSYIAKLANYHDVFSSGCFDESFD